MIDEGQGHRQSKANIAICLYFIIFATGPFRSNTKFMGSNNMERKIMLIPMGAIEGWVLDTLEKDLAAKFNIKVERHNSIQISADAFNPARKQYSSSFILNKPHTFLEAGRKELVLAITDVDLYAEGLNFVFGEAEFGGQFAVISITRLRQSFYSFPENKNLFIDRTTKEAVHELGHVFGLEHCPDAQCAMHFSNSLLDTDRKSASFCSRCQARLEKLII
jgi:archaemetzincin